ncbi:hypothetical protein TNCV_4968241 [Trichonephila clavipes]|nr:hypothetical protein TNCV_4968241 [Trichonephila clavipes]
MGETIDPVQGILELKQKLLSCKEYLEDEEFVCDFSDTTVIKELRYRGDTQRQCNTKLYLYRQGLLDAYHWKQQCPFNQTKLRQNSFTCDSSLGTNTAPQCTGNPVGTQQIPNQRQNPSTSASDPEY